MAQVVGLRKQQAAIAESLQINSTQNDVQAVNFWFERAQMALHSEFADRLDKLRVEYHEKLAAATAGE